MQRNNLLTPPRFMFSTEHQVQCLSKQYPEFELTPCDVSKDHLSIFLKKGSELPALGTLFSDIVLTLNEESFLLPELKVQQIHDADDVPRMVMSSRDCELTSHRLWEISYAMRNQYRRTPKKEWDEFSLPKIPARGLYTEDARQERVTFLKEQLNVDLTAIAKHSFDPRKLVSNIEGLIGSVEVPVGVAGPLQIQGVHTNGLYYAPMATSEGALVASATRGATALSRSGGVNARVLGQRMMRVPLFGFDDMNKAMFFSEWVKDHEHELSEEVRKYSNFAQLVELQVQVMGRNVHVHFIYETGDAAGQNMTTTCTWQACQWILTRIRHFEDIQVRNFLIEANLSNDKKVTYQTFLKGRGLRVLAEAVLQDEVCRRVLKVSAAQLVQAYQHFVTGSMAAGMIGININVANVIAAMFTSLGQDIACVHESSLAQLHIELDAQGDAYCTMTLPSLVIGTVGGGTNLTQQKECLNMIGCAGTGHAHKLGEIIAAYCLALDLSTLAAIAADQFARAHEKLGRNRPVDFLKLGDFNPDLFNDSIRELGVHQLSVTGALQLPNDMLGSSIITELTSQKVNKLLGHFPFKLATNNGECRVMVKVKPLDEEIIIMLNGIAAMCDARLAHAFNHFRHQIGFRGCHIREIKVMTQQDPRFTRHAPVVYGTLLAPEREAYVLVEELLEDLELMDSANDTSRWRQEHLAAAISGIAEVHSIWYKREHDLLAEEWMVDYPTANGMLEKQRLWELLGSHAREEFPEWVTEEHTETFRDIVANLQHWWPEIEKMPRTLIHNDFNPRNIAFRSGPDGPVLCAYDWELATLHLPQHDLAELLGFTLSSNATLDDVNFYIELHRLELEKQSGHAIDPTEWRRGYVLSLFDLIVNRVPMYMMAHTFRHYGFMERTFHTFHRLLELEGMPTR